MLCAGFVGGMECAQVAVELSRINGDSGGLLEPRKEIIVDLIAGLRQREEDVASCRRRSAKQCDRIHFEDVIVDDIKDF